MSAGVAGAPPMQGGWRAKVQKVGGNLAAMVMPNIGAFIAWGLLTAMFIETGWTPNADLAELVGPTITVLLPVLIGYTGGRLVHGQRGAVIGAVATMGIVVGAEIPQFLGAMIFGPLAAYLLKRFDALVVPRIKTGFEMLVNNFSLGILGFGLAIVGYLGVGPLMSAGTEIISDAVQGLVEASLLPLAALVIEPAKVLFLNNALNHGVLGPIGVIEAQEAGRSIMFMLETNPGPGLGVLLAFWLAGPKAVRLSVPGAAIIHFLGGIHEIYFPYVLMKPKMILAAIAGGATGIATFMLTGAGLTATPSPGSIFAYFAVAQPSVYVGMLLGIVLSTAVSCLVGVALLRFSRDDADEVTEGDLAEAVERSKASKPVKPGQPTPAGAGAAAASERAGAGVATAPSIVGSDVRRVVVACEAGMGSSVLLTSQLTKRLDPHGVEVEHRPVNRLTDDEADVVLCHAGLVDRARQAAPSTVIVPFQTFMGDPAFDRLVAAIEHGETIDG